jgi:hypothetical protein
MPDYTPRFSLPYMVAAQAQKELTHSQGINRIDAAVQPTPVAVGTNTPPGSPTEGQAWVLGSSPTGVWAGYANKLAQYVGGGWIFLTPFTGMRVYNLTDSTDYRWTGAAWAAVSSGGVSDGDKGDITVSGTGATYTIDNNVVTFAKMQDIATTSFIGRITASTGDPENLTGTQATTLLDAFTSSLKGLAPASGGGTSNFLRADGTWAAPPGGGGGISGVDISKNSGATVGTRPKINFIEGSNVTLTIADDAGNGEVDVTIASSGGGAASVSTSGTAPGSPADGDLWWDSDLGRLFIYYDDGSSSQWVDAAPPLAAPVVSPFGRSDVVPDLTDFAWVNQETATATQYGYGIGLGSPANGGGGTYHWNFLKQAVPATPYRVRARIAPGLIGINYSEIALLWRESSSGKLQTLCMGFNSTFGMRGQNWTSPTVYSGTMSGVTASADFISNWVALRDDGTNRYFELSSNGDDWVIFATTPRTTFLTPDEIGFGVNALSYPLSMTVFSWEVS